MVSNPEIKWIGGHFFCLFHFCGWTLSTLRIMGSQLNWWGLEIPEPCYYTGSFTPPFRRVQSLILRGSLNFCEKFRKKTIIQWVFHSPSRNNPSWVSWQFPCSLEYGSSKYPGAMLEVPRCNARKPKVDNTYSYIDSQISSRPHTTDFPQKVAFWKGNPRLFQGNPGWWNIMIWPDISYIIQPLWICSNRLLDSKNQSRWRCKPIRLGSLFECFRKWRIILPNHTSHATRFHDSGLLRNSQM